MNKPTHDEVAQRAYHNWQKAGSPDGRHAEFWLEAEEQLGAKREHEKSNGVHGTQQADPLVAAGKEAAQKHDARAPQVAHHTGPKAKPPETGKPVWSRPHSS